MRKEDWVQGQWCLPPLMFVAKMSKGKERFGENLLRDKEPLEKRLGHWYKLEFIKEFTINDHRCWESRHRAENPIALPFERGFSENGFMKSFRATPKIRSLPCTNVCKHIWLMRRLETVSECQRDPPSWDSLVIKARLHTIYSTASERKRASMHSSGAGIFPRRG